MMLGAVLKQLHVVEEEVVGCRAVGRIHEFLIRDRLLLWCRCLR